MSVRIDAEEITAEMLREVHSPRRGFILPNATLEAVASFDESHETIAENWIASHNKKWKFDLWRKKHGGGSATDFLISEGAIKVGNRYLGNKRICYDPNAVGNDKALNAYINYYRDHGYVIDVIASDGKVVKEGKLY